MEGYIKTEVPKWLSSFNSEEPKPFINYILDLQEKLCCEKLIKNRDKALEELVREKLYKLNYKFRNDELFYAFVRDRITKIGFEDEQDKEYLFLDYESEKKRGVLLVTFSSKIEYNLDTFSGKITMSIG